MYAVQLKILLNDAESTFADVLFLKIPQDIILRVKFWISQTEKVLHRLSRFKNEKASPAHVFVPSWSIPTVHMFVTSSGTALH